MRILIGEKDGAPNFYMRYATFEPGGESPSHSYPWEHETFILNGEGILEVQGRAVKLKAGDVAYVPPNAHHHFNSEKGMEMI